MKAKPYQPSIKILLTHNYYKRNARTMHMHVVHLWSKMYV